MSQLGYIELGTPSQVPLIFFHGFPSAAHQILAVPDLDVFARFRLIAVDRPGFGDSAPSEDGVDLVARFEPWLQSLGIDRFHLLAVSGGARAAYELANRLRGRALSLTSICPLGPLDEPELYRPLPAIARGLFALARVSPWLLAKIFAWRLEASAREGKPAQPTQMEKILSPRDRQVLRDPHIQAVLDESYRLAFKQGALAVAREARRMQQPWRVGDWDFPFAVRLYHGDADLLVPPVHSQWLHRRSPGSRLDLLPGEGHYSLPILRLPEILAQIG